MPQIVPSSPCVASHLTPGELAHLERRLLEERHRVRRAIARCIPAGAADGAEPGGGRMPDHMAELGSETMRATVDAALAARESETLIAIDEALRRLYRAPERFGRDELTGEPIPFARLDLLPWTRRGVAAAAERERPRDAGHGARGARTERRPAARRGPRHAA